MKGASFNIDGRDQMASSWIIVAWREDPPRSDNSDGFVDHGGGGGMVSGLLGTGGTGLLREPPAFLPFFGLG